MNYAFLLSGWFKGPPTLVTVIWQFEKIKSVFLLPHVVIFYSYNKSQYYTLNNKKHCSDTLMHPYFFPELQEGREQQIKLC